MLETHGYEYISISWAGTSKSGKTNVFSITNNRFGGEIGVIKWNGPWRQYCFYPAPATIFSKGCLEDINDFISNI